MNKREIYMLSFLGLGACAGYWLRDITDSFFHRKDYQCAVVEKAAPTEPAKPETSNDSTAPSLERFVAEDKDYFASRDGFQYSKDDVDASYRFSIECGGDETLMIVPISSSVQDPAIIITDDDHDRIPDSVSFHSGLGSAKGSISRQRDSKLEFSGMDEKAAKELFGYYTTKYQEFRKANDLDTLIAAYAINPEQWKF